MKYFILLNLLGLMSNWGFSGLNASANPQQRICASYLKQLKDRGEQVYYEFLLSNQGKHKLLSKACTADDLRAWPRISDKDFKLQERQAADACLRSDEHREACLKALNAVTKFVRVHSLVKPTRPGDLGTLAQSPNSAADGTSDANGKLYICCTDHHDTPHHRLIPFVDEGSPELCRGEPSRTFCTRNKSKNRSMPLPSSGPAYEEAVRLCEKLKDDEVLCPNGRPRRSNSFGSKPLPKVGDGGPSPAATR